MSAEIRPQKITFFPAVSELGFFLNQLEVNLPKSAHPLFKLLIHSDENGLATNELIDQMRAQEYPDQISEFLEAIDILFRHGFIHKLITYTDGKDPAHMTVTYQDMLPKAKA